MGGKPCTQHDKFLSGAPINSFHKYIQDCCGCGCVGDGSCSVVAESGSDVHLVARELKKKKIEKKGLRRKEILSGPTGSCGALC